MLNFFITFSHKLIEFHNSLKARLNSEKWTMEETLKLIDAIQAHGDDWEEITKVIK